MPEPSIRMTKIWEDVDFYEIRMEFEGNYCSVIIDFYTTNEDLEEFRQEIENFSNLNMTEFTWTSGNDIENVTHFLSLRFFQHNDRDTLG
jgi:hypothetical protein